jgi:hypothetical protein
MTHSGKKSMEEEKALDRISFDFSERGINESHSALEKDDGTSHPKQSDSGYLTPIRSRAQSHPRSHSHSRTLRSERSYGGEDGFSCNQELDAEVEEDEELREQKRWEVSWDGENDPMSPRSMGKARKWAIVLIMASSALCVYVIFAPMA